MTTAHKTVFAHAASGAYIGPVVLGAGDLSPLEPGVWLLPAGTVELAPPQPQASSERPYWDGTAWELREEPTDVSPPPPVPPTLAQRQAQAWEAIKAERERRRTGGVQVGEHWFHSDDASRIQQLALRMMGPAIPEGLQWKTLTLTPPQVFVEMTPALAAGIFAATAASDQAIFAAAEAHRTDMEASAEPEHYDCSAGWPTAIWET